MDDERVQVALAYLEKTVEDLSQTLVAKEKRLGELEERVERLETALRILARRREDGGGDVLGALPEEDPVPRSG